MGRVRASVAAGAEWLVPSRGQRAQSKDYSLCSVNRLPFTANCQPSTVDMPERRPHDRFMQAIAVFKFVKAILFLLAALGAFGLMQRGVSEQAREWGSALAFTSGQHL